MKGQLVLLVVLSLGYTVPSWGQFGGAFFGGAPETKQVSGAINIVVRAHSPSSPRGDTSFTNGVIPEIVKMDDLVFQFQIGNLGARNLRGALLKTRKGDQPLPIPKTGVILGEIPVTEFAVKKDKKMEVVLGHQMIVTYVDQKDGYVKIIPLPIVSEILPFRRGLRQTDYGMVVFVLVDPGRDVIDWPAVQKHSALKNFSADALYRILYNGGTPVVGTVMRNLVSKAVEQIHNRPPVEETPPPAAKPEITGAEKVPPDLPEPSLETDETERSVKFRISWGKATAVRYRIAFEMPSGEWQGEWQDLEGEPGVKTVVSVDKLPDTRIEVGATVDGKPVELKKLTIPSRPVKAWTDRQGDLVALHLEDIRPYRTVVYRYLDPEGKEQLKGIVENTGDSVHFKVPYREGWTIEVGLKKPWEKEPSKYFHQRFIKKEGKS